MWERGVVPTECVCLHGKEHVVGATPATLEASAL